MAKQKRGNTPVTTVADGVPSISEDVTTDENEVVDVTDEVDTTESELTEESVTDKELTEDPVADETTSDEEAPAVDVTDVVTEATDDVDTTEVVDDIEDVVDATPDDEAVVDTESAHGLDSDCPNVCKLKDMLSQNLTLPINFLCSFPPMDLAVWTRDNIELFATCPWNLLAICDILRQTRGELKDNDDITVEDTLNAIIDGTPVPMFRSALVHSRARYKEAVDLDQIQDLTLDELSGIYLGVILPELELYLDDDRMFKTTLGANIIELIKTKIKAKRPALKDIFDWVDEDLYVYVEDGTEPRRYNGVLVRSLRRMKAHPRNWTVSDINLWIEDQIPTPQSTTDEFLLARAIQLHGLHYSYTKNSVKRYIRTGFKLKPNSMGVYAADRFRDASDARTWSIAELVSYLQGHIRLPEERTAEVYNALRERFEIDAGHSDAYVKDTLISLNNVEVSMSTKHVQDTIAEFVKTINQADALGHEETGRVHSQMVKMLQNVLVLPTQEFFPAWGEILRVALEHRAGAFSEYKAFTFVEHTNVSAAVLQMYNLTLTAIINTCDPVTRQANTRCVNVDGMTTGMLIGRAQAQENLTNFYKL